MNWHIFGQQLWNGVLNGAIYVLFASGVSLIFGVMRVINMAHGEVAMLGAMSMYELMAKVGLGFWPSVVITLVAAGVIGAVVNRIAVQPVVKSSQLNVLLTTLALSIVLVEGATAVLGSDTKGIKVPYRHVFHPFGLNIPMSGILVLILMVAAMTGLFLFLARTRFGRMARATGENTFGAQVVGINTRRVYDYTLALGSLLAGLAGVAVILTSDATPTLGQPLLLIGFATVIVAGIGSISGAVVVGMWFGITGAMFGQYVSSTYSEAYIYATMIVVLLLWPHGLFGQRRANPLIAA
ncbi:branched-chain amino acid ABC transporter permease [Baekduia soli]|uniref:Branched-chain amino acid ABC transporter permease n=1 Tax=Baekduia soli TaxID=496014 RepID=A0A5B8U3H5_9ACTN|nr:branched-chain amino acid ABC transporter permease [Baekduia soli]QEC47428.1 branched-chain amino acid ABC transporter permease [Baekduia soli]